MNIRFFHHEDSDYAEDANQYKSIFVSKTKITEILNVKPIVKILESV